MLSSDSYFLSNEAIRKERHADLLAWLVGLNARVLFDETHLGVSESPGVAASALELALEGLHLSRRLNREAAGRIGAYRYEGLTGGRTG